MSDYMEELRRKLDPDALKGAGAFEAKLTFEERCQILGLMKAGAKRSTIAAAYNIARPTVGYIVNASSPHYRNVRREWADMGPEAFIKKYLTDDVLQKANEAQKSIRAQATGEEDKAERRHETTLKGPNRNASGNAGLATFVDSDEIQRQVSIEWLDEPGDYEHDYSGDEDFHGPGWYVIVPLAVRRAFEPDADRGYIWPGTPANGIEGPYPTSQMAVRMFAQESQYTKVD